MNWNIQLKVFSVAKITKRKWHEIRKRKCIELLYASQWLQDTLICKFSNFTNWFDGLFRMFFKNVSLIIQLFFYCSYLMLACDNYLFFHLDNIPNTFLDCWRDFGVHKMETFIHRTKFKSFFGYWFLSQHYDFFILNLLSIPTKLHFKCLQIHVQ